ncbi:hypothetical protein [Mycobacterium canetti]|uniref:hypothetical protein n=1 Tax=Mycobacterium canetti TaxID=78331 RepID=UPI001E4C90CD|nr:hypothetical protein [Mycobacterium canetti]
MLDALAALDKQRNAVVVVGAQAIYLRSGQAIVAIAETTKDGDLAVDPRELPREPLLEEAMKAADFYPNLNGQPGAWLNRDSIAVDLMVPDALSEGGKSHRGARIPPHSNRATRRTVGLEAAVIDNNVMPISALDPVDGRTFNARVAGPAALLIAKVHKIYERLDQPDRLNDKDAHDVYRLLVATTDMAALAATFERLLSDPVSKVVTQQAIEWLRTLFADGPAALGSIMAGRAEEGVGEPDVVSAAVAALAADVVAVVGGPGH